MNEKNMHNKFVTNISGKVFEIKPGADFCGVEFKVGEDRLSGAELPEADLSQATLHEANLDYANFGGANLSKAYLRGASLRRANLAGADLRGANLQEADLLKAELRDANLKGADLRMANLRCADFSRANLQVANFHEADLRGANLHRANLQGANLQGANFQGSVLDDANLEGAILPDFQICPQEGSFIGYKKLQGNIICELEILGPRTSSLVGRKCRAQSARVLRFLNSDKTEGCSMHDPNFTYKIGEIVSEPRYNDDIRFECAPGIHFFMTKEEAEKYV